MTCASIIPSYDDVETPTWSGAPRKHHTHNSTNRPEFGGHIPGPHSRFPNPRSSFAARHRHSSYISLDLLTRRENCKPAACQHDS